MGFFDSKSQSTVVNQTDIDEYSNQVAPGGDNEGNIVGISGAGNIITLSDQGAIALSKDVSLGAFDTLSNIVVKSLDYIGEANEVAAQTTQGAVSRGLALAEKASMDQAENLTGQFLTYAIIGGAIWGLTIIIKGGK